MNIKKAIKIAMAKRDITQKELSEKSGVSETSISQTLTGKTNPNTKTLARIAKAMNMEYSELIKLGE
jgi:transcriptional regulator with XRE-family HTH domain